MSHSRRAGLRVWMAFPVLLLSGAAGAAVVEYGSGCDQATNWYYLQFYNNSADAADLNVCVVTNGAVANNHYDYVYGQSYSKLFWIGTCEKSYRWYWTDDGSIDQHCR